jgi:Fe2+ transport system protein A
MRLNEGKVGSTYIVKSVAVKEAVTRRLEALGVNEMTPVTILNKKGSGSVIFKVRGTRLAVGKTISDGITVEEVSRIKEER